MTCCLQSVTLRHLTCDCSAVASCQAQKRVRAAARLASAKEDKDESADEEDTALPYAQSTQITQCRYESESRWNNV